MHTRKSQGLVTPREIVDRMMAADAMSQWLGIQVVSVDKGTCELQMTVRSEMLNGFSIAHGGITYSLADSALAFAANSHGAHAVSIQTDIAHLKAVKSGTVLKAVAIEIHRTPRIGKYRVDVFNSQSELVSQFAGTVYVRSSRWE